MAMLGEPRQRLRKVSAASNNGCSPHLNKERCGWLGHTLRRLLATLTLTSALGAPSFGPLYATACKA